MNKVIKHIFFILLVVGIGYRSYGQLRPYQVVPVNPAYNNRMNNPNPERRIETIEERFIQQQLQLNPRQSRIFFPVYQEYQRELFNIRRLKRLNNTNAANGTNQINKDMEYDADIYRIRLRFKDAFLKILPPEKVSQLYKAERVFNDELVRQLSERRPVN